MRAYYDLSVKPATYDFSVFLSICKTIGVDTVVFDVSKGFQKKKFPQEVAKQMYENVLKPMCRLWGMDWVEGLSGDVTPGYRHSDALKAKIKINEFQLNPGKPTVTIRESIRNKHRDSNKGAWLRFAEEIGAIVIEDAYIKPISLIERIDLYRNAKQNYFCSNGPGAMLFYTNIPYKFFSPESAKGTWGVDEPFQFPWKTNNQEIIWKEDTYENICAT